MLVRNSRGSGKQETMRVKRGHRAGGDTSAAPRPAGKLDAGPKVNHEIDATKKK